jgi:hypothetical protein
MLCFLHPFFSFLHLLFHGKIVGPRISLSVYAADEAFNKNTGSIPGRGAPENDPRCQTPFGCADTWATLQPRIFLSAYAADKAFSKKYRKHSGKGYTGKTNPGVRHPLGVQTPGQHCSPASFFLLMPLIRPSAKNTGSISGRDAPEKLTQVSDTLWVCGHLGKIAAPHLSFVQAPGQKNPPGKPGGNNN